MHIFGRFSKNSEAVLIQAQKLAQDLGRPMRSDMLVLAIVLQPNLPAGELLRASGLSQALAMEKLAPADPAVSAVEMQTILEESVKAASKFRFSVVEVEHILYVITALSKLSGHQLLRRAGIDPEIVANRIREWLFSVAMMNEPAPGAEVTEHEKPGAERGGGEFEKFVFDVTEAAARGELDPVVGREKEIDQIIHVLLRRRKNNPLLLGEPGVGKTALVDALAQRIVRKAVPKALVGKRVLTLDLGLVVAGTMYRGQFEERLKGIIQEVRDLGDCILFIDEIHTLTGTGSSEGGFDAANILKPALARGEITLIGATTNDEFRKHILKDKALERRFQPVMVEEPTPKEAVQMLRGLKRDLEKHHNVVITDEAVKSAVELSDRYIHDRFLPDKAIDILDQAATLHAEEYVEDERVSKLQQEAALVATQKADIVEDASCEEDWEMAKALSEKEAQLLDQLQGIYQEKSRATVAKPVDSSHVAFVVSRKTGIPLGDIQQSLEPVSVSRVAKALAANILGQDEAVKTISQALMRAQLGLNPPGKPTAGFLLVGPTGVGKTETARILAREVFGDARALIKIDMSEYMERHNVSNLVGAPAGYVGYDQGGSLTEQIRRRPYSVVLFDEVEKAHPDVFHILLQILEDGALTDNTGNTVSFEHAVIIMTSNIGMETYNQAARIGFDTDEADKAAEREQEELRDHVQRELQEFFRPELLGRLTGIIHYQPLDKKVVRRLVQKKLAGLKKSLKGKDVSLQTTPALLTELIERYEPEAGARSIDRVFLRDAEPPVIQAMIEHPDERTLLLTAEEHTITARPASNAPDANA